MATSMLHGARASSSRSYIYMKMNVEFVVFFALLGVMCEVC